MLSLRVLSAGAKPKLVTVPRPPLPADSSIAQIKVIGAGLHQVVRARASGEHYSVSAGANTPGIDGTGINLSNGKLVYFVTPIDGEGSFSEFVNVPTRHTWEIPDGVDPVQAAGLMNPLLSSWLALRKRVDFLQQGKREGWSCLIMGATSVSGKLAIRAARELGATTVIGAARTEAAMKDLGLDGYVVLQNPPETTDFTSAAEVDVVLDYVYGPHVRGFLQGTRSQRPLTWVSIGALSRLDAEIPAQELRRRDLTMRGSGVGSWSPREAMLEIPRTLQLLGDTKMDEVGPVPMKDGEEAWDSSSKRVVFVTEEYVKLEQS